MRINEMNPQEKSVALAKAAGLSVEWNKYGFGVVKDVAGNVVWDTLLDGIDNDVLSCLYDLPYMALAWRVLNWAFNGVASDGLEVMSAWNRGVIQSMFYIGVPFSGDPTLLELSPADAQRLLLDKVLELAGLVEVDDV